MKQRLAWESGEGPRESRAESGSRTYRVAPQGSGRAKLITTDQSPKGGPVKKSAYYASTKNAKEAAQRREDRRSRSE